MKKDDAVSFYGTDAELARVLDITRQAVGKWGDVIPEGVAYKLQVLTGGRLKVDTSLYHSKHPAA